MYVQILYIQCCVCSVQGVAYALYKCQKIKRTEGETARYIYNARSKNANAVLLVKTDVEW